MRKTAASFMLTGSLIWLFTTIWLLAETLQGVDLDYMPTNAILFFIILMVIPTCFLIASIFLLFDNN